MRCPDSRHQSRHGAVAHLFTSSNSSPQPAFYTMALSWKKFATDRLVRGLSVDGRLRLAFVNATEVAKHAQTLHALDGPAGKALGSAMTAAMLLASLLKGEERVQLDVTGNGYVKYASAEAVCGGGVRGYANTFPFDESPADVRHVHPFGSAGTFTVSRVLFNHAKPFRSSIPLMRGDVDSELQYYFAQSDQTPTVSRVLSQVDSSGRVVLCGGLLAQATPGTPPALLRQLDDAIGACGDVGDALVESSGDRQSLLSSSFVISEATRRAQRVRFECPCGETSGFQMSAAPAEKDAAEERGEKVRITCLFCQKKYLVNAADVGA